MDSSTANLLCIKPRRYTLHYACPSINRDCHTALDAEGSFAITVADEGPSAGQICVTSLLWVTSHLYLPVEPLPVSLQLRNRSNPREQGAAGAL